jgi:hypothetical protein
VGGPLDDFQSEAVALRRQLEAAAPHRRAPEHREKRRRPRGREQHWTRTRQIFPTRIKRMCVSWCSLDKSGSLPRREFRDWLSAHGPRNIEQQHTRTARLWVRGKVVGGLKRNLLGHGTALRNLFISSTVSRILDRRNATVCVATHKRLGVHRANMVVEMTLHIACRLAQPDVSQDTPSPLCTRCLSLSSVLPLWSLVERNALGIAQQSAQDLEV